MKRTTLLPLLFLLCYSAISQSIDGGYGQGLINLVPDTGFEFKNGFKYINPSPNLGFWRLNIVPQRLSTGLQEVQVALNFSIDQPTVIRGQNANGGETLYKPSDFNTTIKGSMNFIIEGTYTDPTTGKQYTFENKKYVSELGSSTINSGLFTYGPDIVNAMARLKITQEADPLAAFLNTFKVKVTSIKAISRNYQGFASMDNELGKRLEQKKTEAEHKTQTEAYLRQGHVQYGIRDYQGAKELYQKAYALNKSPETLQLIEDADKALKAEQERLKNESTETNNNGSTSVSSPILTSTSPSSTQTNKTNTTQNKNTTSTQNTKKANTASNDIYNKAEQAGKTLEQMEYEREAYQRQQKEKLQQATNPGGYYMEKSGLNAYFDAQHERLNKEAAEKETREEREWLAKKRREERAYREAQQKAEEWRNNKQEELKNKRESRLAEYNTKGGETNYNFKYKAWKTYATQEMHQINTFLTRYGSYAIGFQYPENNCEYVEAIQYIQNATMPNDYKDILIRNVLKIRYEYYKFYMDNAYIYENWKTNRDNLYYNTSYATCGNYLDDIASTIKKGKEYSGYGYIENIGAMEFEIKAYDELNLTSWEKNPRIPIGSVNVTASYKDEIKASDIHIKDKDLSSKGSVWESFHLKPYKWSQGFYSPSITRKKSDNVVLWNQPEAIKSEMEKYLSYYDIKRTFRLNSIPDELRMAWFNYHTGNHESAYNHYMRYITLAYGSFQEFKKASNEKDIIHTSIFNSSYGDDKNLSTLLGAVLFMEAGLYDDAFHQLDLLKTLNIDNKSTYGNTRNAITEAIEKLSNQIYYRKGAYSNIKLPKDEVQIKEDFKYIDQLFDPVVPSTSKRSMSTAEKKFAQGNSKVMYLLFKDYPIKAHALLKLGNEKMAKKLFEPIYKYSLKKGSFSGTNVDIEAFKEVVNMLYPSSKDKIQYKLISGYDVTNLILFTYEKGPNKDIYLNINDIDIPQGFTQFDLEYFIYNKTHNHTKAFNPNYISKTLSDLDKNDEWEVLKTQISKHNGSKQDLEKLYNQMDALFKSAKLEPNDEALEFLTIYIQFGVALAKFYDMVPVIAEKQRLFPESKNTMVEENLAVLMSPRSLNSGDSLNEYLISKSKNGMFTAFPRKEYFENEVKNSEHLKNALNTYLSIWSRDKVASPMIPYLYSLYAKP